MVEPIKNAVLPKRSSLDVNFFFRSSRALKVLNDTKLMLEDQGGQSDSFGLDSSWKRSEPLEVHCTSKI